MDLNMETENTPLYSSKEEVVARVQALAAGTTSGDKQEIDLLKSLYYKFHNQEVIAARQAFIDGGGEAEAFIPDVDMLEPQFREAIQTLRQRRAEEMQRLEQERVKNLDRKLDILERIKEMALTPEDAAKNFTEFKQLQASFKEGGPVPPERATEIWKNYQLYCEQFYDLLKMGHEMREYDFRKNLEQKLLLCQRAEALADVEDVLSAFDTLQHLHQEWKEIGPVEKDLREDLWNRFKAASTVINKRHQAHYDAIKAEEEENLKKKEALCEKVEAVDTAPLNTFADWDAIAKDIQAMQLEWRNIGRAPQKDNQAVYERFRTACDKFFTAKQAYFKAVKANINEALDKRRALVEKAEALKDSREWKETAEALIQLQKEWKELAATPRKQSEQLWQRFKAACDAFFEARKANWEETRQQREADREALRARAKVFKEKAEARAQKHAEHIQELIDGDRQKLKRAYDAIKAELQSYENNIGFLTAASKKGNSLIDQTQKKIESLKKDLEQIAQKLKES